MFFSFQGSIITLLLLLFGFPWSSQGFCNIDDSSSSATHTPSTAPSSANLSSPLCSKKIEAGVIVGIAIGATLLIGLLISTALLLCCRKAPPQRAEDRHHQSLTPDSNIVLDTRTSPLVIGGILAGARYVDLRGSNFHHTIPQDIKSTNSSTASKLP